MPPVAAASALIVSSLPRIVIDSPSPGSSTVVVGPGTAPITSSVSNSVSTSPSARASGGPGWLEIRPSPSRNRSMPPGAAKPRDRASPGPAFVNVCGEPGEQSTNEPAGAAIFSCPAWISSKPSST